MHFAYKVPRGSGLVNRVIDKLSLETAWFPAPWRHGKHIPWRSPIKAPHSITYNLLKGLQARDNVKLYDMYEERSCHLRSGDKFLGQPINSWEVDTYKHPNAYKVTARTFDTSKHIPDFDKTVIMPYTHDPSYNLATRDFIEAHGKNLIIISHKIWTDTWSQSPIRDYVDNLLRVNMCIHADDYPVVKTHFNPKGKRRFLYVGNTNYYKNTKQLEAIAAAFPGFEGGHIGSGTIAGWHKISEQRDLTPEFMSSIAKDYDIFLNTSSADASPTTILEQMCFGFTIACTPESAYDYDTFTTLHTTDTRFNCEMLQKLQRTDSEILLAQARKNREYAETYHNWNTFCKKVIDFVYDRPKNAHGMFLVD